MSGLREITDYLSDRIVDDTARGDFTIRTADGEFAYVDVEGPHVYLVTVQAARFVAAQPSAEDGGKQSRSADGE